MVAVKAPAVVHNEVDVAQDRRNLEQVCRGDWSGKGEVFAREGAILMAQRYLSIVTVYFSMLVRKAAVG